MKARDKKKFRKLAVSGVCAAVLLVCNTPAATITNSSLPVAVLDFSVPTNDAHWSWARNGIADLLQIELQQAGVLTLDRDFVQLVLREQKLLSEPGTTQDQFKLASLLHAGHLITGRVMSLEGGRFRVEATAFSVEAIEVVATGVGEGAYPLELSAVLQSVSRTLAKKLTALGVVANEIRASGYTPKPESLILFYRGLNAFTRGQPEVAVACFMNSAELDPDFAAPLLWEIKAYEVSGFQPHAAIRREEIVPLLKKIGVQFELPSGENRDAKPVLAVLNVSAESSNREDGVRLSTSVSATLKASLLSSGKVQVFAFENIGAAMTEQDLKLSALFARQGAPRYGRWLMADALLQCRVRKIDPDRFTVEFSLVDPLRTLELARIEQTGKLIELNAVVAASVERILAAWKKEKIAATVGSASTTNLPGDLAEEEIREMRPPFQRLVRALAAVRRAPKDGERRGELANGFVATGRLRQAGEEINRRLDTLDIHAPKTDLTYYGIYRWVVFDVGVARPWADTEKVTRLIDELLTNHPHSLAAGCLLYNLAINEWRAGNSEEVIQRAVGSRNVLKGTSPPNSKGGINARNAFIGATYFLEGASLFKIGKLDEAETVLSQGLEFAKNFEVIDFTLPLLPSIQEWNGPVEITSYGGDQPGVTTRLTAQLALIAESRLNAKPINYTRLAQELFTEENSLRGPSGRPQNWSVCAQRIATLLEQVPIQNEAQFNDVLSLAKQSMHMVHFCKPKAPDHEVVVQPFAQRLIEIVFKRYGLSSFADSDSLSNDQLLKIVAQINGICQSADLLHEAINTCAPLFAEPFTADFGFSVLLHIDAAPDQFSQTIRQLTTRSPSGEADAPKNLWIKIAQRFATDQRFHEALSYYAKAVTKETTPESCPGLSSTLIEAALENNSAHAKDEAHKLCAKIDLPDFGIVWFDWFNAGRKHQQARNYSKAISCYKNVLEFLENPEISGFYHLEEQPGSKRIALRWGKTSGISEVDLRWSEQYDSRWQSAAFYLTQCLIETGQQEEAAPLLRRIALEVGGDKVDLLEETTWFTARYTTEGLGVRAAEMLKQLHAETPE